MAKLTDLEIAELIAKNKKWCVERVIATRINAKGRRQFQVEFKNSTHKQSIWRRFRSIAQRNRWQWVTTAGSTRGRVKVTWRPDWVDEDDLIKCRYLIRRFWVLEQQQQQQNQQNPVDLEQNQAQHEHPVMDFAEQGLEQAPAGPLDPEVLDNVQMEAPDEENIAIDMVPEQLEVPNRENIVLDDDDSGPMHDDEPINLAPIAVPEMDPVQPQTPQQNRPYGFKKALMIRHHQSGH